jgi:hypothetical protein
MSSFMARRPEFGNNEEVWSREDLKEITRNLAVLSEPAVREVYQRAYHECAIINSRTFPSARSMQELVTAWKLLRKWRRYGRKRVARTSVHYAADAVRYFKYLSRSRYWVSGSLLHVPSA